MTKYIFAMDTPCVLTIYKNDPEAIDKIISEINECDLAFGYGTGEFTDINNANGSPVRISGRVKKLVERSLELSSLTGGCFDITLGRVSDLWGFIKKEYRIPEKLEIDQTLLLSGYEKISLEGDFISVPQGIRLDAGAIAKGYVSDLIRDICNEEKIESALFSLGGNIVLVGSKPNGKDWKIAIQDPEDESAYICFLNLSDTNVITSGSYQRFFEKDGKRYSHILDPQTGYPVENELLSVTVICKDAAKADAYSTALFVMGLEKGIEFQKEQKDFEAIFITNDRKIISTGIDFSK